MEMSEKGGPLFTYIASSVPHFVPVLAYGFQPFS